MCTYLSNYGCFHTRSNNLISGNIFVTISMSTSMNCLFCVYAFFFISGESTFSYFLQKKPKPRTVGYHCSSCSVAAVAIFHLCTTLWQYGGACVNMQDCTCACVCKFLCSTSAFILLYCYCNCYCSQLFICCCTIYVFCYFYLLSFLFVFCYTLFRLCYDFQFGFFLNIFKCIFSFIFRMCLFLYFVARPTAVPLPAQPLCVFDRLYLLFS